MNDPHNMPPPRRDSVYGRPASNVPIPFRPHGEERGAFVPQTEGEQRKDKGEREEPLPLPKWLLVLYFVFPAVLYLPDALFNYYVYSDGVTIPQTDNLFLQVSQIALWGFLSLGIVGMAYLLSMLAPWHWMHGHYVQAFFCGLGVVIATGVTIWNSLAYRSQAFHPFATDQWVYSVWPQLRDQHFSLTMIFAAVAPPFWGIFWAVVQPTQTRRNLAHLQENHAERVMRLQQEAEIKSLRAETNAKIRAAQLKGMAATAAAAREQMGAAFARKGDATATTGPQEGVAQSRAGTAPTGASRSAIRPPRSAGASQRAGSGSTTTKATPSGTSPRSSTPLGPDGRGSTAYIDPPSSGLPRSRVERGS